MSALSKVRWTSKTRFFKKILKIESKFWRIHLIDEISEIRGIGILEEKDFNFRVSTNMRLMICKIQNTINEFVKAIGEDEKKIDSGLPVLLYKIKFQRPSLFTGYDIGVEKMKDEDGMIYYEFVMKKKKE